MLIRPSVKGPLGLLPRPDRCVITQRMADAEAHSSYPLGSPLASIAGIAESMLERNDLDEDIATRLRAIRDLALDALRSDPGQPFSRPPRRQN
jgi:hypothetical protein